MDKMGVNFMVPNDRSRLHREHNVRTVPTSDPNEYNYVIRTYLRRNTASPVSLVRTLERGYEIFFRLNLHLVTLIS